MDNIADETRNAALWRLDPQRDAVPVLAGDGPGRSFGQHQLDAALGERRDRLRRIEADRARHDGAVQDI